MSNEKPQFAAQLRIDLPASAVRHVLDVFQSEIPPLTNTLQDAAVAGDAMHFGRIAHHIAGSAAAVGAKALEQGARLAIACAKSRPERISDVAVEVEKLGRAAIAEAEAVTKEIQ